MTFKEYVVEAERLRRELASSKPVFFTITDAVRSGAAMALAFVICDALELTLLDGGPVSRLKFVAFWSVLVALFALWRARRGRMTRSAVST